MFVPPKFCINIVSIFSWDLLWSQGKIKAILFKNLKGQTKSIMVFLKVAYWQNSRQYRALPAKKTNNPFHMNANICDPLSFFDIHKVELVFSLCERRDG